MGDTVNSALFAVLGVLYLGLLAWATAVFVFIRSKILVVCREAFSPDSQAASRVRSRCRYLAYLIPFAVIRVCWCGVFSSFLSSDVPSELSLLASLILYAVAYWTFLNCKVLLIFSWFFSQTRGGKCVGGLAGKFLTMFFSVLGTTGIASVCVFGGLLSCSRSHWSSSDHFSDLWATGITFDACRPWSISVSAWICIASGGMGIVGLTLLVVSLFDRSAQRRVELMAGHDAFFVQHQQKVLTRVAAAAVVSLLLRGAFQAFVSIPSQLKMEVEDSQLRANALILIELFITEVLPLAAIIGLLHNSVLLERKLVMRESSEARELRPHLLG